jgi:hypothetical protein
VGTFAWVAEPPAAPDDTPRRSLGVIASSRYLRSTVPLDY